MLSYALVEYGEPFATIEREDPTPSGKEVVVKTLCSGVCHSDVHIRHGYFDYGDGRKFHVKDRGMRLPMTLGHEIYGEVVAVGPEAQNVSIGDKRLVFPWIGCDNCDDCRGGRENECQTMNPLGILRHGGYATHVVVPDARFLVDIGDLDPVLTTPHACSGLTVYTALKKALPVGETEWLAVMGAGGLGLNAIAIAKAMGVANIVAIDIAPEKLDAAREMGATDAMTIDGGVDELRRITGGALRGVVDTVGAKATAELSLEALRKSGRYVLVGLHGGSATVPLPMLAQKITTISGSYVGSLKDLKELIALVRGGAVKPIPTTTRPLEKASETLDDLEAGRIVGRVVLTA